MASLVFIGNFRANEQENCYQYFEEGAGIPRAWAATRFLMFDGQPQNSPGTGGCAVSLAVLRRAYPEARGLEEVDSPTTLN